MNQINETGGAYIGYGRASFPFAKLTVDKYKLGLKASILGNLVFRATDIIAIEPGSTGLSKAGLKIRHSVKQYNAKVIFIPTGSAALLLEQIRQTGFWPNSQPNTLPPDVEEYIALRQQGGSFPLKTAPLVAIVVIWNALILYDQRAFFSGNKFVPNFGIGSKLALSFVLMVCVLLLTSQPVRRLILKPNRTVDDIKLFLYFLMLIVTVILIVTSVIGETMSHRGIA